MSSDIPVPTRVVGLGLTVTLVVSAVAGALVLGAPGSGANPADVGQAAQEDATSQVQVVHAAPNAGPVDVSIDGETVLSNVSYADVSAELPVEAGPHTVTITGTETGTALFEANYSFLGGTNYTVVAASTRNATDEGAIQPVFLVDSPTVESRNQSAVRLAHYAYDAPAVDVTVQGTDTVLFDNVSARNISNFTAVPAGNYTLEVRPATANDSGEVLTTANVTLAGGVGYTVFALEPSEANATLDFAIVERSIQTPEGTPTPTPSNETTTETEVDETATETGTAGTATETGTAGTATETGTAGTATETEG